MGLDMNMDVSMGCRYDKLMDNELNMNMNMDMQIVFGPFDNVMSND